MTHLQKQGYIYVLTHPSEPGLYKIGVTIQGIEKRLSQHNTNYTEYAGRIVKDTGLKWELKEFHAVQDIYYSEVVFWATTGIGCFPHRNGIEIYRMDDKTLQDGLHAAIHAGVRPSKPAPHNKIVHNRDWMITELEGTGITLIGKKFHHAQYTEFQCNEGHTFIEIPRVPATKKSCPVCDSE